MSKKKRKGPTPRRRTPRMQWVAQCEKCGAMQPLHIDPSTDSELLMSPCGYCGTQTAVYFERPMAA